VVKETLTTRSKSQFNRAILYLDFDSLAGTTAQPSDSKKLEESLLEGSWDDIPGFEHPVTSFELVSSKIYEREAAVRVEAFYEPYGERFKRDLRFYLHNPDGYWTIRRVEALAAGDADPDTYGQLDLSPSEVVSEMLRAVKRGDWEIALRYFNIEDIVRNLPEYVDRWNYMSAAEHSRAITDYRGRLISGQLDDGRIPLKDIETWKITKVNYTDTQGLVLVENSKVHTDTAKGPMTQLSVYTFRLEKIPGSDERWQVVRYDASIIRR
jgi:hypothetical protein